MVIRLRVQDDRTTQQNVEIFERDRVLMSSMHRSERREIRQHAAVKSYAMQIGRKLQEIALRSCLGGTIHARAGITPAPLTVLCLPSPRSLLRATPSCHRPT